MADYDAMQAVWETVRDNPTIKGDMNDYHNLSVVFSREDDYSSAYEIVARGLEQYPYNTDLLADAINYGMNCSRVDECKARAKVLLSRPRSSWTWRAFTFLIDFLQSSSDWEEKYDDVKDNMKIALEIAQQYQQYMPDEERSYVSEYELRQQLAKIATDDAVNAKDETTKAAALARAEEEKREGIALLKRTIENGQYAAVQCSMRYADIMFSQQNYDETIKICNRALEFGEESASAKLGYFMYLSAQSREIFLSKAGDLHNKESIETIYAEYLAALSDLTGSHRRNIRRRVKILEARSGVTAPKELTASASKDED